MRPAIFLLLALISVSCASTRERLLKSGADRQVAGNSLTATPSIGIHIFQ